MHKCKAGTRNRDDLDFDSYTVSIIPQNKDFQFLSIYTDTLTCNIHKI